jgi:hypothetical protein
VQLKNHGSSLWGVQERRLLDNYITHEKAAPIAPRLICILEPLSNPIDVKGHCYTIFIFD